MTKELERIEFLKLKILAMKKELRSLGVNQH